MQSLQIFFFYTIFTICFAQKHRHDEVIAQCFNETYVWYYYTRPKIVEEHHDVKEAHVTVFQGCGFFLFYS